ncbi:MAG: hypothetical protein P8K08_04450 [Fuerstiella sp.]|nr:hypothetical protein [Fuerstiella sp.]
MTLQEHQRLRMWLPIVVSIVVWLISSFALHGSIGSTDRVTLIIAAACFFVIRFLAGLLPADCPKCGKRLKFQRSLDNSEGSDVWWHEYYCFKCKRVITWERSERRRD